MRLWIAKASNELDVSGHTLSLNRLTSSSDACDSDFTRLPILVVVENHREISADDAARGHTDLEVGVIGDVQVNIAGLRRYGLQAFCLTLFDEQHDPSAGRCDVNRSLVQFDRNVARGTLRAKGTPDAFGSNVAFGRDDENGVCEWHEDDDVSALEMLRISFLDKFTAVVVADPVDNAGLRHCWPYLKAWSFIVEMLKRDDQVGIVLVASEAAVDVTESVFDCD